MLWGTERRVIRRYLRDPNAHIWSDELVSAAWNQAQREFQDATDALEDARVLPVPPSTDASYMHECERAFLEEDDRVYRCLHHHQNWLAFCCAAEIEVLNGSTAQATEAGSAYTHPWEAYIEAPNREPWHPWPRDMHQARAVYFDSEPLSPDTRRALGFGDPSYIKRSGEPVCYYDLPDSENAFTLYPRPNSFTWEDPAGDGMITFVEGDTVATEIGEIISRTGSLADGDTGIAVNILDQTNNVLVIYRVLPQDISGDSDVLSVPDHLVKYVRYRVLERLYGANNDGRIVSLSRLWGERYQMGLHIVKRYLSIRSKDRDYRFVTQPERPARYRRHPRLPSTFPAI